MVRMWFIPVIILTRLRICFTRSFIQNFITDFSQILFNLGRIYSNLLIQIFSLARMIKERSDKTISFRLVFCTLLIISFFPRSNAQSASGILDYSTTISVKNNELIEEKSYLIQISDKQSDWLSEIEILYDKGTKLEILEASVINSRGEILRKLSKKEIITKSYISDGSFFEDDLIKEFTLRWNEYPYRIKYSYRKTTGRFIHIVYWGPMVFPGVATAKASLKVELPSGYEVKIYSSGNLKQRTDSLKESRVLSWDISGIAPMKKEIFAPPFQEILPIVFIVPKVFKYGITGNLRDWTTFGEWQEEMNKDLVSLPVSEQIIVNNLIREIKGEKEEIVKKLFHYMQDNTRYINVSIDIGGLKPYPASYVSTNKYGDCKALTIFMKALLKHAGIDSFYTMIYAGINPVRLLREFPGQQFNHVILCVPVQNDTIWLENTTSYLPCNYLGTFTQNRYGLLVNGEKSTLVKTPALSSGDVLEKSLYHFYLDHKGNGKADLIKEMRGDDFEKYSYINKEALREDQKSTIREDLSLANLELADWKISNDNRDQTSLVMEIELVAAKQFRNIGNSLVVNSIPMKLYDLESPGTRKYPVRINYPVNRFDSIIYDLPFMDRYKVNLPGEIRIETKFGSFKTRYVKDDTKIIVIREFQLFRSDYPLSEYPDFYSFFESIKESLKRSQIILDQ
ncbi:MAG: hypothetical protein C0408_02050 [Odoribacter sp.]|nr:hypothetical protein [Odoribacter sp.]